MSIRDLNIMLVCIAAFLVTIAVVPGCGQDEQPLEVIYKKPDEKPKPTPSPTPPKALTDSDFQASCFSSGCHNASAPNIPEVGKGFKESPKVKARIQNKTMPPGGWSDEKIARALEYFR